MSVSHDFQRLSNYLQLDYLHRFCLGIMWNMRKLKVNIV